MELFEYTAFELSEMLAAKEISSEELTESVYSRIKASGKPVNAFVTLTEELGYLQAKAIDARRSAGETLSPLAGIPVAVKDNICTKGIRTTCASRMLADFVPPYQATAIGKLNEAGAVMLGKTNMDEFAMGSSGETSYFGLTRNPHNPEYVPGGSSSGSAAAVADGQAVVSLGSDTGGSIRLPAAYCGVVGLKPTYGSVSRFGLIAFASSLEQIGPIGRSVADVAMLYQAICGYDAKDATTVQCEYPLFKAGKTVKGMKIGIPKEYFGNAISEEIRNAVYTAAKIFEENGAVVKEISLPSTEYALSAYYIISSAEASSNLARFDGVKYGYRAEGCKNPTELYERSRSEGFGAEVKRRILLGAFALSSGYHDAYYKRAKATQTQIINEFEQAFAACDLLLTPTAASTAFKIDEKVNDPVAMYQNDICTVPANIAGLPAISVPCGFSANGLPLAFQLIAPKFQEQRLFHAAGCFEKVAGTNVRPVSIQRRRI